MAQEPTNHDILGTLDKAVTSASQLCDNLRALFRETAHVEGGQLSLEEMREQVYLVNRQNGWYDDDRSVLEGIMLIVTEAAEAAEAFRVWGTLDQTGVVSLDKALPDAQGNDIQKPEGLGSEYADIFIRLLDQCRRDGVNLRQEFVRKMEFNMLRGYKHGGKSI